MTTFASSALSDVEMQQPEEPAVKPSSSSEPQQTRWERALSTVWRTGIPRPTCAESLRTLVRTKYPWLIAIIVLVPLAWASHWKIEAWGHDTTFVLCFLAMIPLQKMFDWGGDKMGTFLTADFRDLLVITMSNAVEATLSIILLRKCELRLLQSTITGVVLLHLLLIPGVPFFVDGSQIFEQILHPHHASQNLSLLMIGVLGIVVPTAYFAALDSGAGSQPNVDPGLPPQFVPLVSDYVRRDILSMSRGISVILIVIYVVSRWYRHSPHDLPDTSANVPDVEEKSEHKSATVHPLICLLLLAVVTSLMAPTAEFFVSSIEHVRETSRIQTEWFGLVLLPMMSCSADAVIGMTRFCQRVVVHVRRFENKSKSKSKYQSRQSTHTDVDPQTDTSQATDSPSSFASKFAHGRPIDLSIQFTLWWTPFLVLLGWWSDRPMHLLFDYFEVALLLGSSFLVNYIIMDHKTNMSEGLTMISFYAMIATATWFYPGQPQVAFMLQCPGSVAEAVATGVESDA